MAGLLSDLLSAAAEGTGFLVRHFPLRVRLQMVVAEGDAAETGIRYGRTNAAVYGILASAHHFLRLKKQEISIQPDFTASQGSVEFSLHGRMLPLFALLGTGNIAGRFLAKTLKRNRRTRAAKAAGSSADHKDGGISMNNEHPINGLLDSSMQNLRSLVDANTVIGEAITTPDGTVIIQSQLWIRLGRLGPAHPERGRAVRRRCRRRCLGTAAGIPCGQGRGCPAAPVRQQQERRGPRSFTDARAV